MSVPDKDHNVNLLKKTDKISPIKKEKNSQDDTNTDELDSKSSLNKSKHYVILGVSKDANGKLYYALSNGGKKIWKQFSSEEMIAKFPKVLLKYLESKITFSK